MNIDSDSLSTSLLNARCLRSHAADISKLKTLIKTDIICLAEYHSFSNDDTNDVREKLRTFAINFNSCGERFENLPFFGFLY